MSGAFAAVGILFLLLLALSFDIFDSSDDENDDEAADTDAATTANAQQESL